MRGVWFQTVQKLDHLTWNDPDVKQDHNLSLSYIFSHHACLCICDPFCENVPKVKKTTTIEIWLKVGNNSIFNKYTIKLIYFLNPLS